MKNNTIKNVMKVMYNKIKVISDKVDNHTHSEYSLTTHNHSGYASSNHNHDGVYSPINHTHTAIAYGSLTSTPANYGVDTKFGSITLDPGTWIIFVQIWNPAFEIGFGNEKCRVSIGNAIGSCNVAFRCLALSGYVRLHTRQEIPIMYEHWLENKSLVVVSAQIHAIKIG